MDVVNSKNLLYDAKKHKYAVCAFNVENMEMIKAVIKQAVTYKSPVIIASSTNALKYVDPIIIANIVKGFCTNITIPIVLHLDHGESIELVSKCLKAGYSSIMIDGSKKSYIENINITKQVADLCHYFDITVEGELGAIGGKIDAENIDLAYTNPDSAVDFVDKTNIDSIAVAIGTVHGIYMKTPMLDYQRCKEISTKLKIPLVLHGASGLSYEQVRNCIENGITKVNYATELRIAYTHAVKEYLDENPNVFDPKKYGEAAMDAVGDVVLEKMITCNSIGRAIKLQPKLIVFDFDGVVVDSEKVFFKAWKKAIETLKLNISDDKILNLRSCDKTIANSYFKKNSDYDRTREKRKEYMSKFEREYYDLKPHIFESFKFLNEKGYKIIIASSSMTDTIKNHLINYGLINYIDRIVSTKDVTKGKPFPDIYFYIAKLYKIKTEDILVFEDSPNGITSAYDAECHVCMIPDLTKPTKDDLSKVDIVIPSAEFIRNFIV